VQCAGTASSDTWQLAVAHVLVSVVRVHGTRRAVQGAVKIRLATTVAAYAQTIDVQIEHVLVDALRVSHASTFVTSTCGKHVGYSCAKYFDIQTRKSPMLQVYSTRTPHLHIRVPEFVSEYTFFMSCAKYTAHLYTCFHVTWTADLLQAFFF